MRKTSYIDKGASGESRNAQRNENILWMCGHHIFQHKSRSLLHTLWLLLSLAFMLFIVVFFPTSIIIPLTWFRNFFRYRTFSLTSLRRKEDCRRSRLTPFAPFSPLWQLPWLVPKTTKKKAKSIFIYNFRVKIWIAAFFMFIRGGHLGTFNPLI